MRDNLIRAPRGPAWISVKRVREVAAENGALAKTNQLTNSKRPTQHADVRVNAHHQNVENASFVEEIQDLLAIIGHSINRRDIDQRSFISPRIGRFA